MQNPKFKIRTARESDAADIAVLTSQLGYDVEPHLVRERLAKVLARSDQRFFVADVDERPVGWVHTVIWEYVDTAPFVVIAGLVVDSAYRKHGIGRQLMETAEAWAVEQECPIVRLWSSSGRTAAHRFYEGLGYTRIKTQFAFAKSLDAAAGQDLNQFVPRIVPY